VRLAICECGNPNPRRSEYGCDDCKRLTYQWHRRDHAERAIEAGRPEDVVMRGLWAHREYSPLSWSRHQGPAAMRRARAS
jgi:hypothetical protein